MNDVAIRTRAIAKSFGSGSLAQKVLKGIDLEVNKGEFLMLCGPSGSGKTTLLSLLGCVLRPSSGELSLFGEDIARAPESAMPDLRLRYIGFVFQAHNLLASLTALENVAFQLELRGCSRRSAIAEAKTLLERVGLGNRLDHKPKQLSGGQRQRVAIARAIAGSPPLILADEPTASLDAESGLAVTTMLRDLARERGHTVVVVTHDNRVFHLADRIVHIEDGIVNRIQEQKAQ